MAEVADLAFILTAAWVCYVYAMPLSFSLRAFFRSLVSCRGLVRSPLLTGALAGSRDVFGQEFLQPEMWSEIQERLGIPVLLAFAFCAILLLVLHRTLRRETESRQRIELETEEERERLNAILNRAGVGVLLIERSVRLFDVNHRWCQMFGYRRRDVRGQLKARDLVHVEEADSLDQHIKDQLAGRAETQTREQRFVRKDGSVFWGLVSTSLVNDKEGRGKWCVAMITDIDAQKRAEQALRESEERLRFITDNTQDVVWQLDSECRFTYVNSADERLRGYTRDEVIGRNFKEWLTPVGQAVFDQTLAFADDVPGSAQAAPAMRFEVEMRCKDGGTFWAEINSTPCHGPNGSFAGYIGVTRDATQRRKTQEKLRELTIRDSMTGLFNRRFLDESLERELSRAERDRSPMALLMIDIDHFKRLNDTWGHLAGDEVIKGVAVLIRNGARGGDLPCRYGGEEFLLVLPNVALDTAVERAEQLRHAFENEKFPFNGALISTTVSIGVAMFPEHGRSRMALIDSADRALYSAKGSGRNRVIVAS